VSKDGTSELINGSAEGGISLHAMSKLLVGTDVCTNFYFIVMLELVCYFKTMIYSLFLAGG